MLVLNVHRQPWQESPSKPPCERISAKVIHKSNKVQMLRNHLLPEMRLSVFDTMERFSKCHFPQDIKSKHLVPDGHVQSPFSSTTSRIQPRNKCIYAALDNIFLFRKSLCRKGGSEKAPHSRVLSWIALTTDAAAIETRAEDVVEVALGKDKLPRPRTIDCFPGLDGGKREFVG